MATERDLTEFTNSKALAIVKERGRLFNANSVLASI